MKGVERVWKGREQGPREFEVRVCCEQMVRLWMGCGGMH